MLNLLWAALSVAALVGFWRFERRRQEPFKGRFRRTIAVLVTIVALFPSVSDSDDLFNFSLLHPVGKHGGVGNAPPEESREKANLHLARLLQTLEHVQISAQRVYLPALAFVSVCCATHVKVVTRALVCRSGRAPPASYLFPL